MLVDRVKQLLLFDEKTPLTPSAKPQDDDDKGEPRNSLSFDPISDYELVRSRRRTLSLSIKNGRLHVRAPLRAPKYWIENTILEKKKWIDAQILEQRTKQKQQLQINHRSTLTLNGQLHTICFCQKSDGDIRPEVSNDIPCDDPVKLHARNRRGKAVLRDRKIHFKFAARITDAEHEEIASSLFVEWLKNEAPALLEENVWQMSKDLGFADSHKGLRFRMTKSAWGYCTSDGIIQLNPSIILAPPFVRDYVIIHELCHLRHANHSKRFWQLVAQKCDRWRAADRWLDDEGHRATIATPNTKTST